MTQRFSLDQQSFERFVAAASQYQSLQMAYARRSTSDSPALLLYLLDTLRAIDAGELSSQMALERVVSLAQRITDADGAGVWLVTTSGMARKAIAGIDFDNDLTQYALWARLKAVDDGDDRHGASQPGDFGLNAAPPVHECEGDPTNAPSLLIAPLPEQMFSGALAIFSRQTSAFGRHDHANLTLLAGLIEYILAKTSEPMLLDDLYLPGVGTRAALAGDADEGSPFAWGASYSRFTSNARQFVSGSSRGLRRAAGALSQSFGKSAAYLQNGWRQAQHMGCKVRHLTSDDTKSPASETLPAARSAGAGMTLDVISGPSRASLNRILWGFRRLRFHGRKLLVDTHELIAPLWKTTAFSRSAAIERLKFASRKMHSRIVEHNRHGRVWIHQFRSRTLVILKKGMHQFRSNSVRARRAVVAVVHDRHVQWPVLKRLGTPGAVLAIIVVFVGMLAREQHRATAGLLLGSDHSAPGSPAQVFAANVPPAAVSILARTTATSDVLPKSHGRVTDRETEITLAEMSPYEVRTTRRAAELGDDEAAWELGMLYESGNGVPQNCSRAAEWVTKAAQLGNGAAEYNLGLRYREGDGVAINLEEAERWLRKAQLHNDPQARRALALLLAEDQQIR